MIRAGQCCSGLLILEGSLYSQGGWWPVGQWCVQGTFYLCNMFVGSKTLGLMEREGLA